MKHPKQRVRTDQGPRAGSYVLNGTYQILHGDTVISGTAVHELFEKGVFKYQFLHRKNNPERRSRICRCSSLSETEWLAGQVTADDPIVVAMIT